MEIEQACQSPRGALSTIPAGPVPQLGLKLHSRGHRQGDRNLLRLVDRARQNLIMRCLLRDHQGRAIVGFSLRERPRAPAGKKGV